MRNLIIRCMGNNRIPVQIDSQTSRALGSNHAEFVSYLGVLTRSMVSIFVSD